MALRLGIPLFLLLTVGCRPSVKYAEPRKNGSQSVRGGASDGDANKESGTSTGTSTTDTVPTPIPGSGTANGRGPEITSPVDSMSTNKPTPAPQVSVASDDANLTYAWTTKSGPASLNFLPSNVLKPEISAPTDGTYVAVLTVTDGAGASSSKEFTIVWDTTPPVITMPADLSVTGPVQIKGAQVTDADKKVTLTWRLVLPSSGLTFADSSILEPNVTPASNGVYVLELKAADSLGQSSTGYMNLERYTAPTGSAPLVKTGKNLIVREPSKPEGIEVTGSGNPLTYQWSTTGGPANLQFQNATDLKPVIAAPQDGVYVATLTATDAQKRSSSRSIIVVWDTLPPDVTLVSPLNINRPTQPQVTVTDANWRIAYLWEQIDGPGNLTFSSRNVLNPTISAATAGKYTARLTATDAVGNKTEKTLIINWSDIDSKAPEITVGPALVVFRPTTAMGFTVTDADPKIVIKWDQITGPGILTFQTPSIIQPTISADKVGDYLARVTATDSSGNRGEAFLRIQWTSGDSTPPVIKLPSGLSISVPTAPVPASVTDSNAITLKWTQISGPGTLLFSSDSIAAPLISATLPGSYVARLIATDSEGNSSFADLAIVWIVPDRDSPVINMGPAVRTSVPVVLQNVTATDADKNLTFEWIQISGPSSLNFSSKAVLQPTVSASAPGDYVVTLTAKDSKGNQATGILALTWFVPDQTAPVLAMGPNLTLSKATVLSQVSAKDNDPNLTVLWVKESGPGTVTFTAANQINPTVSMDTDGTYVLRVNVNDSAGNKATGTITILWDRNPPAVFAGANRTITGPVDIQDSTATDVSPIKFAWRTVTQPLQSTLTYSNVAILHPQIAVNYPGNYVLELTATDALGFSSTSRVTINANVGFWVQTDGQACSSVCSAIGKAVGTSRGDSAQCASGENRAPSAYGWINFRHGFWPDSTPMAYDNSFSSGRYCYRPEQKRDNDKTDITVGCFCN